MRSRAEILIVGLALASGCGFADGDPWGRVDLSLVVGLRPPASRLDGARLKTANDFRIAIDTVTLEVSAVALTSAGGAGGAFDPADPPPGYALCHNGHCHSDDGRLVAYEDIAAELGGGATVTTVVVASGDGVSVGLGQEREVALACERGCEVDEPATIDRARITIAAWTVRGTAFDALTGDAARLPAGGLAFELEGATPIVWTLSGLGVAFGPGEELERAVALEVEVPPGLFDGVAWDTMSSDEASAAVAKALVEEGE